MPDLQSLPDRHGHFGQFGGMFVPETLMTALLELTEEYERAKADPAFHAELDGLLRDYCGRPTPLYFAERLTEKLGGAKIYLKREDLLHTGAHKINNALGQILLARRMGKKRIIALQINLRPAELLREPLREIERRRPPAIIPQQPREFFLKSGVRLRPLIFRGEFEQRGHQRLGHKHAAKLAEMAVRVGERLEVDHGRARSVGARCGGCKVFCELRAALTAWRLVSFRETPCLPGDGWRGGGIPRGVRTRLRCGIDAEPRTPRGTDASQPHFPMHNLR